MARVVDYSFDPFSYKNLEDDLENPLPHLDSGSSSVEHEALIERIKPFWPGACPVPDVFGTARAISPGAKLGGQVNPFRTVALKPMVLGDELRRLYEAQAFAIRQYGLMMNCHMTISFTAMGLPAEKGLKLLAVWNKEVARWLRVGAHRQRERITKRAAMGGSNHVYVWVLENSAARGAHVHQLLHVPTTEHLTRYGMKRKPRLLHEMSMAWWERAVGRPIPTNAIDTKWHIPRDEADAIKRGWGWFRYITKTVAPDVLCPDDEGRLVPVREIFNPWPFRESRPLPVAQIAGTSRNIGAGAQRKAGFVSRYERGHWGELYDGRELDEHRHHRWFEAVGRTLQF